MSEHTSHDVWAAPRAHAPVRATVAMPGSKSVTNRALVLAALSDTPSLLRAPLRSRDTLLMAEALRTLGVGVENVGDDWRITPAQMSGPVTVDCGLAGTVMRFLPPVATLAYGRVDFDGDAQARTRPMGNLLDALRHLGAHIDDAGRGTLPFTLSAMGVMDGGTVEIDASASSQFVSALLLAGARFARGVEVRHRGGSLPSMPHIAMSVHMLRQFGVTVDESGHETWRVSPGRLTAPAEYPIEPDLSNAAPFLAAAMVAGGSVTVPGWPASTTQPGDALRDLLAAMGARVTVDARGLTVNGGEKLLGLDADLHDVGELTPVLAALCALATTPSRLRGIAHLRGHETDRLAALTAELNRLGGDVTETDDGLRIEPRPLRGGVFGTYHDHRMAQAGALLGLGVDGVGVENVATTSKTLPDFVGMWTAMLGESTVEASA